MTRLNLLKVPDWSEWGESVSLIANSGIQIMDFELDLEQTKKFRTYFVEEKTDTQEFTDDFRKLEILPDGEFDGPTNDKFVSYEISALKALQPFIGAWIPIPFFRTSEVNPEEITDIGPTTWSRMRISLINETKQPDGLFLKIRVQIALDTTVGGSDDSYSYLQPNEKDTGNRNEFRFVSDFGIVSQFLTAGTVRSNLSTRPDDDPMWVTEWIKSIFERFILYLVPETTRRYITS